MSFHLLSLKDPNEDLINELELKIGRSVSSDRLFVETIESGSYLNVILIYKGRYKVIHYNREVPESLKIDGVKYFFTAHFIERYMERFEISRCVRYTLIEMLAKEILFIHNNENILTAPRTGLTIKSRFGRTRVAKKGSKTFICVTYLVFGRPKKKYRKIEPKSAWFDKY